MAPHVWNAYRLSGYAMLTAITSLVIGCFALPPHLALSLYAAFNQKLSRHSRGADPLDVSLEVPGKFAKTNVPH